MKSQDKEGSGDSKDFGRKVWKKGQRKKIIEERESILLEQGYDKNGRLHGSLSCQIAARAGFPNKMDMLTLRIVGKEPDTVIACNHFVPGSDRCDQLPTLCPNRTFVKTRIGFPKLN